MTPAKTILILIWQLHFVCNNVLGQYRFERPSFLNTSNGLPTNEVRAISKAPDGFIWIATTNGLCRFDGLQVRTYQHDSSRNSIASSEVNSVLPLTDEVWAGTSRGISVLSLSTDTFRHHGLAELLPGRKSPENSIVVLKAGSQRRIWIGTRRLGLWYFDAGKKMFNHVVIENSPTLIRPLLSTSDHILSIETSRGADSMVWAGTPGGLIEVNMRSGKTSLHVFEYDDKQKQVAANAFRRLYLHDDGKLYTGTWAHGVNIFDPKTKTYEELPVKNERARSILKSAISSIYRYSDKEFWITCGKGLLLYNSALQDVTWFRENIQVEQRFAGVDLVDDHNRMWHFNVNGIQYFDPQLQQFESFSYDHLYGKNWAFTFFILPSADPEQLIVCPNNTDGIYLFNRRSALWQRYAFANDEVPKIVRGFVKLSTGDLLLSSYEGMYHFSWHKKRLKRIRIDAPVKFGRFSSMVLDRDENAWIAVADEGLLYWDRKRNRFRLFEKAIQSLAPNAFENINRIYCDKHNNIWFAHGQGYGVYLRAQDSLHHFTIDSQAFVRDIQDFAEDKNGRIWVTGSNGMLGYGNVDRAEQGLVQMINSASKGLSGSVHRLAADNSGRIWGYTARELFNIDPTTLSFNKYSLNYGLDDADFFHFSFVPGGQMVFGGRTRIVFASPATIRTNMEMPHPYINELEVLGQQKRTGTYGHNKVSLQHHEKNVAISFSALAFTLNRDIKFRYRLAGVHDWSTATEKRSVNYTNLKGGDYTFEVQASNNEGQWNPQLASLTLHVQTPWWESTWFYIAGIAAVCMILYGAYMNRISAIHRKQRLQFEYERKLATVEMSALRAQMNPHFLFNSLNSIDSYIIKNESRKASEYLNSFAKLIRLILHNSKSNLIPLKDELETLDLYLQMEALRFGNKFDYRIEVDDSIDTSGIQIPPLLIQPYVENAIWHGIMHQENGTRGKVFIRIWLENGSLYCTIEDNGIGRKKAMQLAAQSAGPKKKSMGMQITKERMEIMNKLHNLSGKVEIMDLTDEDQNATGTKIKLVIPSSKTTIS
jgi:ligand-binding sensor domain-containing protein